MNFETRHKIALFRYTLIAPIIANTFTQDSIKEYFEEISNQVYDVPHYGRCEFTVSTLKNWLLLYRQYGFDGLLPKDRSDKNSSRKISPEVKSFVRQAKLEHPRRSASSIHQELIVRKLIQPEQLSLSTIQRFISKESLSVDLPAKERRAFEMPFPNECWQSDVSAGPYLTIDGKKRKTFLIVFLDDCSRVVTHGEFFFDDTVISLQAAFKQAVAKRGIPKKVFVDNGKIFKSDQFQMICASLGTVLSYAQPYSPESKGKIERFFRTLKDQWMHVLDWSKIASLEELNELLWSYLEQVYHQNLHSSIQMKPIDRFTQHIDLIRFPPSRDALDQLFLHRLTRKVKKDATISLHGNLFEVPFQFVGETIQVRFDPSAPEQAYIFADQQLTCEIRPVNKVDNSQIYRSTKQALDFSKL